MFDRIPPHEKEIQKLERQEKAFLEARNQEKVSKLNQLLEDKVPRKLQGTLDRAFSKAFYLVFEKGTGMIEKTYSKEELKKSYEINEYIVKVRQNRRSLQRISNKAALKSNVNLLLSGVSGVGLGILGIGLPDIALFTALMLKGIYEIALNYGFDYDNEAEKKFILLLIQGAVAHGATLQEIDAKLNAQMKSDSNQLMLSEDMNRMIEQAAAGLSKELLYMKFLQGIPVVGVIGGAYDAVYMQQIMRYAELKYRKRFYENKELRDIYE